MNISKLFLPIVVVLFIIVVTPTYARSEYPKEYQLEVMEEVNATLEANNLRTLEINSNICALAEILAQDNEANYPEKAGTTMFTNTKYKDYLQGYTSQESLSITKLEPLIEFEMIVVGKVSPYTTEDLLTAFADIERNELLFNEKLTVGCVGLSDGSNNKPFMYFIAVEEGEKDNSWFGSIKQFWNNFWSYII